MTAGAAPQASVCSGPANTPAGLERIEFAPAKVNLTLEILGRRVDGYHQLHSLVAFTAFGDELHLSPAESFSLAVEGPFAAALSGVNLIARARAGYRAAWKASAEAGPAWPLLPPAGGAYRLIKRIPVAAGLGGGSADAAAALRLMAGLSAGASDLARLIPLAASLGADIPVCLFSQASFMTGVGERISPAPGFPPIPIVLVNLGAPLSTAAVFSELRAAPLGPLPDAGEPPAFASASDVIRYAQAGRNDLEAPARRLLPEIGEVLGALARQPGALLARLSGSGPTCYALFASTAAAEAAAEALRRRHPQWWVQETTLAGAP